MYFALVSLQTYPCCKHHTINTRVKMVLLDTTHLLFSSKRLILLDIWTRPASPRLLLGNKVPKKALWRCVKCCLVASKHWRSYQVVNPALTLYAHKYSMLDSSIWLDSLPLDCRAFEKHRHIVNNLWCKFDRYCRYLKGVVERWLFYGRR